VQNIKRNQYQDLCKSCDRILLDSSATKRTMSIGWLHILRWHPESFAQYNCIFENLGFIRDKFLQLNRLCRYRSISFVRILRSIFQRKYWNSYGFIDKEVDILFISHLVNRDLIGSDDDFYFGNLPNQLKLQGLNSIISLIDYTRDAQNLTSNGWNKCIVPRLVFARILPFFSELKIHILQQIERRRLKKIQINDSDIFNRVLKEASIQALSNGTSNALRLGEQVKKLLKMHNPKFIIITYEGYAWERLVFAVAKEVSPNIKCIGYQHTAIFESQHSMISTLPTSFNPDFILTTGEITKQLLKEKFEKFQIQVKTLGSPRASNFDSDMPYPKNENNSVCLVLPEGSFSECNILFEFSLECAKKMPDVHFIWRLHPLIDFDAVIRRNSKLSKLTNNITLSKNSLDKDISISSFALYRGSTAIISAISRGLVPIYLTQKEDVYSIDPIYNFKKLKKEVSLPSDFGRIMNSNFNRADLIDLINYGKGFYTKLNKDVLSDLVFYQ
jgi:hypothetical protein